MEKIVRVIPKYQKIFQSPKRYNFLWGGRGRGGTTAIVQYIFSRLYSEEYSRIAFMRYISADIKDSIQKELEDFLRYVEVEDIEMKNREYIQPNGNLIALKSFKTSESDNTAKIKGLAKFNVIAIDEIDQLSEYDFMQLDASLRENDAMIIATFNPPEKGHWIWKMFFNLEHAEIDGYYTATPKGDINAIFSTYEENHFLPENYNKVMESYKETNIDYYRNQIKGMIPSGKTGIIFKNWKEMPYKEFEELPYERVYGLDFGYSNDPAALTETKKHNSKLWTHELIYERGLTNQDLIKRFETLGVSKSDLIIADSAEPKSIEEIKRAGYNIIESVKGADSIRNGIDNLLSLEVFYTEKSKNIKEETLNYTWALDKNKEPTNKPIDEWNHCFTGETKILTLYGEKNISEITDKDMVLTRNGFRNVLKRWDNGKKQVSKYSLLFGTFSLELECTLSHKIWTTLGWKQISELRSGMTVCLSKSLVERFSGCTQMSDTFPVEGKECMFSYGSTTMGKEKKDSTYTTKTEIHGTIESETLNQSKEVSTCQNTQESFTGKTLILPENKLRRTNRNAESGMRVKKEKCGTESMLEKNVSDCSIMVKKNVNFVKINSQKKHTTQDFARINAKQHGEENQASMTRKGNVCFVEEFSKETDIQVLCVVQKIVQTHIGEYEVFDLMVEDDHEYFANGVLVHNCIDSIRYSQVKTKEFALPVFF